MGGEQSRDFTCPDSIVAGNLLAASADAGRVFNVASGTPITLNEIVKLLRELTLHGRGQLCARAARRHEAFAGGCRCELTILLSI